MGTRLIAHGLDLRGDDPALWNLSREDMVLSLHRRDRRAGADVLLTNTFGASQRNLDRLGRGGDIQQINKAAVRLARIAAGPIGMVLGSIGPYPQEDPPSVTFEQARILVESGVDGLVLETYRLDQALKTVEALRTRLELPIVVSLYSWPEAMDAAARRLLDAGADVLGVNCGTGPDSAIEATERFCRASHSAWMVKPSAGISNGPIASPMQFAEMTRRFRQLGVQMMGGCCGTDHTHIAAIRQALDEAIRTEIAPD